VTRRRLLIALFVLYLVLLAWLILYKFDVPYIGAAWDRPRPFKLVPFVASGDADASNPLEVLANVLFFVPFGLYLSLLTRWRRRAVALFFLTSLALEISQHLLSVGSFDSTDVIANTLGGIAGLLLASLVAPRTLTRTLIIGGVVAVLAVAVFIASPLHFAQPRDVVVGWRTHAGNSRPVVF
jgi:glycopeptide antibiotics resistance protein